MYNLTLQTGNLVGADGVASSPDADNDNMITITIDNFHISNSYPIEIAGTILHEGIHAEMKRYVLAKGGGLQAYPDLWHYYIYYKGKTAWPANAAEHALMASKYVDQIASALRAYDNYQYSVDHYKYIALEGLEHFTTVDQATKDQYKNLRDAMLEDKSKTCE